MIKEKEKWRRRGEWKYKTVLERVYYIMVKDMSIYSIKDYYYSYYDDSMTKLFCLNFLFVFQGIYLVALFFFLFCFAICFYLDNCLRSLGFPSCRISLLSFFHSFQFSVSSVVVCPLRGRQNCRRWWYELTRVWKRKRKQMK